MLNDLVGRNFFSVDLTIVLKVHLQIKEKEYLYWTIEATQLAAGQKVKLHSSY